MISILTRVSSQRAVCVVMLLLLGWARAGAQEEQPLNVLFLARNPFVNAQLLERLETHGIRFVMQKLMEPVSAEMLRQFHVVVLPDFRGSDVESFFIVPHEILQEHYAMQRNLELLHGYVSEGGGLLVMPFMSGGGSSVGRAVSDFLAPYGARLHALQVRDPRHQFGEDFAWTTEIARHPAAEGVRRIYYPHNMLRWDDAYATPTFELRRGAGWTALVRGMPSSAAAQGYDYYTNQEWMPTKMTAPPIAAVRTADRGRVGLLAVSNYCVFMLPFRAVPSRWVGESRIGNIDGVFMEKGDGQTPSDGFSLLSGMLRWLGESARQRGLGHYDAEQFAALPRPPRPPAPDWLRTWSRKTGALPHKVMIGARSSFSDGAGTVADYAKAAREAGLTALILTETFERFDPARWPEFLAACARASNDTLTVIPGLDIADQHGTRYLYFGCNMDFPRPSLLTPDGKHIVKTQYFSIGLGVGIMVAHRVMTGSHHPYQLLKHYHGISVYTYRDGRLVDDSLPAYVWQVEAFSNPMPFVVHEVYAPAKLKAAAASGHQLYVMAPDAAAVRWYLGQTPGISHFYEILRMQISAGPLITDMLADNFLCVECDVPIAEVRLYDQGEVIRRWTPGANTFTLPRVKLPDSHKAWTHLVVVDARGRTAVSPGVLSGRESKWGYTWRCADRQNWTHPFITQYTGQEIFHFDIRVPGAAQAGDLAAVHEFRLASWTTYIEDAVIEYCYPGVKWDDYARDGKPVPRTVPIEGYRGKVRFHQFFHPETAGWHIPHADNMPTLKEVDLELLQPLKPQLTEDHPPFGWPGLRPFKPQGPLFPQIVGPGALSDSSGEPSTVGADRSYVYTDPHTGQEVTGELKEGVLDLRKGGRFGGLIALSDGLRVDAGGLVGFAVPADAAAELPAGTRWHAAFVTVKPEEADRYRRLMGLAGPLPYTLTVTQGALERLEYVAYCRAADGGVRGTIGAPWEREYLLPVNIGGINPSWDAVIWRPGGTYRLIPIFEGSAWARLDVGAAGDFYLGHPVMADASALCLGVLDWSADRIEIEVHNPTDKPIEATIRTAKAIADRLPYTGKVSVNAGGSLIVTGTR